MAAAFSHYEVLRKLGAGGMGEVHLALDTLLHRRVAIKFLPTRSESDSVAKKRLIREAQAAAALDHPNICAIYDVGEEQGRSFIVMQYIEGDTIASRLAAARLDVRDALDIAVQIAQALSEAHSRGIVHRDIKPQNIMVTPRGQVKVLDFGLAQRLNPAPALDSVAETASQLTGAGVLVGTMPYMSTEQVRGEALDARTDVFSFGVVLYEMLSGQRLFAASTAADVISAILTRDPPPLARYSSSLPAQLTRIVERCLRKDRADRYASARELLDDLEQVAAAVRGFPSPAEAAPSIAVLPFVNMSADPENEYFCDGLAEELLNALTKIEHLRVAARTSAFSFKSKDKDVREIGRELNVRTVLEGSVRRAGDRIRITAQLVKVEDGYHLWSERYDRKLKDIFDIQDEISLAIAEALKVRLLSGEKAAVLKRYTRDTEAYQLYLRGRYFWQKFSPEGWSKARTCFEQAIQKDPGFALAYSGLADSLVACGVFTAPGDVFPEAKRMVRQALALDASMAEAWCAKAAISFFHDWDWPGGEEDCRQAIKLNPNYPLVHDLYSLCLLAQGRFEEAISESRRACELDPLSAYFNASLGCTLYYARRYQEAEEQLLKAVELDPGSMWGHVWLVDLYEQQARYVDALHHRKRLLTIVGNDRLAVEIALEFQRSGYEGVLLKYLDELARRSAQEYVSPLEFAATCARLGDREKTLDWLERAYQDRTLYMSFLKVRPTWESLQSDPRHVALVRRMGLPL
jgi:eukaryotic-like serine/threonine-protein kinase